MPIMSNKVTYGNLAIKAPITLRMQLLKTTILGAKAYLGTTKDTYTVDNVRWGLEVHVCKEGEPDCTTTYHALSVVFSSDRGNNRWIIQVYIEQYYVTPAAEFIFEAFRFGQEQDVTIDITFRNSYLSVVFNGREILATDLLKKFEQIRTLKANNYFYDPTGVEVPNVANQYLVYNLQLVQPVDVSGVVNAVLPLAISIAVIGVVIALLRTGILRAPVPKPA
jgi:hypothetical protein